VDNLRTTSRFFLPNMRVRGISNLTTKRVRRAFGRQNDKEPLKKATRGGRTWMNVALDLRKA